MGRQPGQGILSAGTDAFETSQHGGDACPEANELVYAVVMPIAS